MNNQNDGKVEKTWICSVCGYKHVGVEPPAKCPVCGVGKEYFDALEDAPEA